MTIYDKDKLISYFIVGISTLMVIVIVLQNLGEFSPDSYSYYDIARSFNTEFGLVSTIRQYRYVSDYNCSFPYLFPFFIWIVDLITGLGIYSGVLINIFIILFIAIFFLFISKKISDFYFGGAFTVVILFANRYFIVESFAARAIPLSILLSSIVLYFLYIFIKVKSQKKYIFIMGVLSGLLIMNRFDEMFFAFFLFVVIIFYSKEKRVKNTLIFLFATLLPVLPWIIYSFSKFDVFFVSDNNGTFLMIEPQVPSYVLFQKNLTFFDDPVDWFVKFLHNIIDIIVSVLSDSSFTIIAILILICICHLKYIKYQNGKIAGYILLNKIKNKIDAYKTPFILAFIYAFYKLGTYAIVGYIEHRYFIEVEMIVTFVIILSFSGYFEKYANFTHILVVLIILFFLLALSNYNGLMRFPLKINAADIYTSQEWIKELDSELSNKNNECNESVLMVGKSMDGFAFGVASGRKTYVSPENIQVESIEYILEYYADADWIAIEKNYGNVDIEKIENMLDNFCIKQEYKHFNLYRIIR